MRTAWLTLLVALVGIAALSHAPGWLTPPTVVLHDLALHDGAAVSVEAMVVRSFPAGAGAQVLLLADGSAQAPAFWSATETVEGAWVRLAGAVERAEGEWQLRVFHLRVVVDADAPLHVDQATRLAPVLKGREVRVLGELAWPEAGEAQLRGAGARLPLAPAVAQEAAMRVGERVVARGLLAYEPATASYRLDAWEVRGA